MGQPLEERKRHAGVAVDAVFDSVSVATTFRETLAQQGIIFCAISEAIREHPELVREYVGSVVPYNDNFFAALNSAVFTDGSLDRKSTRLNSSHGYISYAVFSLKKKTHTPAAKAADTRRRLN